MGNFNMLPVDIIFNILTRLPAELVLDCKLVTKSWNNVINHKQFSQSHLNHCLNNLHSAHGSSGEEKPCHRVTKMKLNPAPFMCYDIAGSCNGLVCLNGCHDKELVYYEPVYICNPITRECVFLPEFERTYGHGGRLVSGFGYVSKTNEYKVVRMYKLLKEPNSVHVEVYTLGSGKGWRNTGKKFNKDLDLVTNVFGELVNESLYWKLKNGEIVAFDLANEEFAEIPTGLPAEWNFSLGVLGGYLFAEQYDKDSKTSHILILKKKQDGSLGWIREFSISNTDTQEIVQDSLVLTTRGTVLCHSETKVLIHDLNSSSSEVLVDFGKDKRIFQAIPHMNTLVSLKALGEENTKTMETVDVPRKDNLIMVEQLKPIATPYLHGDRLAYDVIFENFHSQPVTQPTSSCSSHYAPIHSDHEHQQQQQLVRTISCSVEKKQVKGEEGSEEEEELGAVKEMMYLIAAMQPIDFGPVTLDKPKRRNVRLSNDPHLVAARQRRERISERIRVLQRLVPGGANMDTASVLDEAVRYIKFLKKQVIKLQSVPIIYDDYRWHVPLSENNIVTFTETMPPSTEDYSIPS